MTTPAKARAIFTQYGLRPEPVTGVAFRDLPGFGPVIAISQVSTTAPVYLSISTAGRLTADLMHAEMSVVAHSIWDEIEKFRERKEGPVS